MNSTPPSSPIAPAWAWNSAPDIVKVPYTGDIDSFADVIAGCCVPVVIAGGPRTETTRQFLEMVDNSLKAGGSGPFRGAQCVPAS